MKTEQPGPFDISEVISTDTTSKSKRVLSILRDLLQAVIPAVILSLILTQFVWQPTLVLGQSMEPNLHAHQRIMIDKLSYRFHMPHYGDIVVIHSRIHDLPLIKRVVGLPGDQLEIRENHLYRNDRLVVEAYLGRVWQNNFGPVQVLEDEVFVMGDNRGVSEDSRLFGAVPLEDVIGKAWLSYWPLEQLHIFQ